MTLNLYPYNYYIFYASIVLVIIFIILFLVSLVKMAKSLQPYEPTLNNIEHNTKLMEIKMEAINEKKAEDAKKNKYLKIALPIVLAIKQIYDHNDEYHGLNGYKQAANDYVTNKRNEKDLLKKLKNML